MMDPGSLLGGAAVGYGVTFILDKVVSKLQDLRNREKILDDLTVKVECLQQPVKVLADSVQDGRDHPAYKWLQNLQEQLRKLDNTLVDYSGGIVEWMRTSDELAQVDRKLSTLLQQGSIVLEAERLWCLSEALTSNPPDLRHKRVCRTYSQFLKKTGRDGLFGEDGSSTLASAVSEEQVRAGSSKLEGEGIAGEQLELRNSELQGERISEEQLQLGSLKPRLNSKLKGRGDSSEPEIRYGGEGLVEKLITSLVQEDKRSKWFGLWAMGGAGKTFIAREVFNDPRIAEHFTGGKLWFTVSDEPEEHAVYLLRDLQNLWTGKKHHENTVKFPTRLEDAKAMMKELMNVDKFLLVLDDVWDRKMLGHLDVISETNGGAILVTTRDDNIFRSDENASSAAESAQVEHVTPLSDEDSQNLFSWHAFRQRHFSPVKELETVAQEVVRECKGLPLALKVIGSAMGAIKLSHVEKAQGRKLRDKWEEGLVRMRRADLEGDRYDALYSRLQLSVDHLREEDVCLRDCFFYFAAYPEDMVFDVEHLTLRWVAEGLVPEESNPLLPPETKARACVALLVGKSMIELHNLLHNNGQVCRVHDVMRDLALRNVRGLIGSKRGWDVSHLECLYEPSWRLSEFPSLWTSSTKPLNARALSLAGGDIRHLPNHLNARSLQVMVLGMNENLKTLPVGFFRQLSNLTVLDLRNTGIEVLSGEILRILKALVLLDLRSCKNLRKISRQLGSLKNLETLRILRCHKNFRFPIVETLPKLTTLDVGLGKTPSLQVQLTCALRGSAPHAQFLEPHENLKRLTLDSLGIKIWKTTPLNLSSLAALEELHLEGICWPQGILQFHHLRKIKAWDAVGEIPALDELRMLRELMIGCRSARSGADLPESFGRTGAFPALTKLSLLQVTIEHLTFHPGTMPMLDILELTNLHWPTLSKSWSELHSLTFLHIEDDRYPIEKWSELFSFPNLTRLEVIAPRTRPPPLQFLPALSSLVLTIPKEEWPEDVIEFEAGGQLEVAVFFWDLTAPPAFGLGGIL